MTKFIKCGDTLDITPEAEIAVGTIKKVAGLLCLATWTIPANQPGTMKVLQRGEVINVETAVAIGQTAAGVAVYVDSTGAVTKTADSNTLLGYTAAAVGSTDKTFDVICS